MSKENYSKSLEYITDQLSELPDTTKAIIFYRESIKGSDAIDFMLLGNFESKDELAIELIKLINKLNLDYAVINSENFDQFLEVCKFMINKISIMCKL